MTAKQVQAQADIFRLFPKDNPRHKNYGGKTFDEKALSMMRAALRDDGVISDAEAKVIVKELFDGNPKKLTVPERRSAMEIKWAPFTENTVKERFIKSLESKDRNALKDPDSRHYDQNTRVRLAYKIAREAINDTTTRNGGMIGRDEAEKMADMLWSSADCKLTSKDRTTARDILATFKFSPEAERQFKTDMELSFSQ